MIVMDDRTQEVADSDGLQPCYCSITPSNLTTLDRTLKPHCYKPDLAHRLTSYSILG